MENKFFIAFFIKFYIYFNASPYDDTLFSVPYLYVLNSALFLQGT